MMGRITGASGDCKGFTVDDDDDWKDVDHGDDDCDGRDCGDAGASKAAGCDGGGGLPSKQTSPNLNSADPLYHHQPHRQPLLHSTFMNFLCNVIGRKCCAIPLKIRSQCNKSHSNHIPAVLVMEKDLNF